MEVELHFSYTISPLIAIKTDVVSDVSIVKGARSIVEVAPECESKHRSPICSRNRIVIRPR